jgi:hypothetical protein
MSEAVEHWTAKEAREKQEQSIRKKEREKVLDNLEWHVYGRLWGLNDLMETPPEQRTESAQDDKIKEAHFELTLVMELIKQLRKGDV